MQDFGKLLLRIAVGGLMMFHGISKIGPGFDFQASATMLGGMLQNKGLPQELAYGVFLGEIVAPALVVLGILTRISAFGVAATMGMAVYLAHSHEIFQLNERGTPKIELAAFFFLGALAIAFIGPGSLAIQGEKQKPAS